MYSEKQLLKTRYNSQWQFEYHIFSRIHSHVGIAWTRNKLLISLYNNVPFIFRMLYSVTLGPGTGYPVPGTWDPGTRDPWNRIGIHCTCTYIVHVSLIA